MDKFVPCEKRRTPRLKRCFELRYAIKPEGSYGYCLTQDVSGGGLRITTDTYMPNSSMLILQLNIEQRNVLELVGRVCWSQKIANSYRYQSGVEFTDISEYDKRAIAGYVEAHSSA